MALKYTAFAHALDKLGRASLSLLQQSGDSGANVERLDLETKQKITDVQNKWTANNPAVRVKAHPLRVNRVQVAWNSD
jgi:hypothetical protein